MKQTIRLNERELHMLINESVNRVINEAGFMNNIRQKFANARDGWTGKSTERMRDMENRYNDMENRYNDMENRYNDMEHDYYHMKSNANAFGLDRKVKSHNRVNPTKNNIMQKQFALVRDIEQDVEQDTKMYNLPKKTVDNALTCVQNDINRNPGKFNIKNDAVNGDMPERQVAESVNRAVSRVLRRKLNRR